MGLDFETRQKIKQALNDHRRAYLRKHHGIKLSSKPERRRKREKYKELCIKGCGRTCWHPPYGTGRCMSCAIIESIPNRKKRSNSKVS